MQIQVAGLLQFAVPLFPTAEVRRPPPASMLEEGEPQARALVSQDVESVPPHSLAPSLGFKGLCAPAAVCSVIHEPWFELSVSASLHVGPSLLPASERSAQNPAPVELLRVQPSPADSHVGLPGAAQGAGVALGASGERGPPPAGHMFPEKPVGARRGLLGPLRATGNGEEAGQREGGRGTWLLDSLQ